MIVGEAQEHPRLVIQSWMPLKEFVHPLNLEPHVRIACREERGD